MAEEHRYDAIVVGGGIAGLAAAWELRDRDVLLLERQHRVGGRIRSTERGDLWLNLGAHVYGGPESAVGRLLEATGVVGADLPGTLTGVSYEGRLVADGPLELYPLRLPFSTRERAEFARVGIKLRRLVARYARIAKAQPGEDPATLQQRMLDFMDDRSFTEAIGPMSPKVDAFFRCTLTRGTGEPEQIAAGYGVGYFHLAWNQEDGLGRNILGGPQRLMDALAEPLGERVRLGVDVTRVAPEEGGVVVECDDGQGGTTILRARSAIVATPSHRTADIVEGLEPELERALRAITYGPQIACAYLTDETGPQRWDPIYAIATPGRATSMLFNMSNIVRQGREDGVRGSSFMSYAPANLGRAADQLSDEGIMDLFQRELEDIFPELRGHVVERQLHRTDPGIPYPFVGRGRIQPVLTRRRERIHLAGDYLGSWYAETSAWTARRAAEAALAEFG